MATVKFYLSTKTDPVTGKAPILVRFMGARDQTYRVKSGMTVTPDQWDDKKSTVIIPRMASMQQKELSRIKKKLSEITALILDNFYQADRKSVSKDWLQGLIDHYHNPDSLQPEGNGNGWNFFSLFEKFLASRKLSAVRVRNYRVVFRSLQRFELFMQRTQDRDYILNPDTMTGDDLRAFEHFFLNEHQLCKKYPALYKAVPEKRLPHPRGFNTLDVSMTKIRAFFNWLRDQGYATGNPFKDYDQKPSVFGTPVYLTLAELHKLNDHQFDDPKLSQQRDIFVFQCLIGCRISDLFSLTKDSVIGGAVEYIPRKTKEGRPVTVRVPLNSMARKIIAKYADLPGKALLPLTYTQDYNRDIKKVFAEAGLTRKVTVLNTLTRQQEQRPLNEIASAHLARKTFIGNLYKQVSDPNLVGALSGHKENSKAFARYRTIDDEMKQKLVELFE